MATRSNIAILNDDNSVDVIYCHWDGYLSNNGKLLLENYNNYDKVKELISHGSIYCLGKKINPIPNKKHDYENSQKDVTIYFSRDCSKQIAKNKIQIVDENFLEVKYLESLKDLKHEEEFLYLFKDSKWFFKDFDSYNNLTELTLEMCVNEDNE